VNNLKNFGLHEKLTSNKKLITTSPLDYFAFQKLIKHCRYIITDSGGIQEESTFLRVPCLTLRNNTERPVTCTIGTNTLVPFNIPEIERYISQIEDGSYKKGAIPDLWDGHATERIFEVLAHL
jgi:UDP-N-acetylglucosamine 2-epimerase (non-hydrolysing)